MGVISGPQIGVDMASLPPGETVSSIEPMKVWPFKMDDTIQSTRAPIWFFQPKSMVNELIKVYEFYSNEADNKTGIPKYTYGQTGGGGAISTATGFSMMMSNASKNIKLVIKNIDKIITHSIKALHQHLLLYDPDPVLRKGDVRLIAKGASSLVAKEQAQIRRNEFLNIALHPNVLAIIGQDGLAEILRKVIGGLDLGIDDIVPSKDDMARATAMVNGPLLPPGAGQPGQQPSQPAPGGGQGPGMPQRMINTNPAGNRNGGHDFRTAA